MRSLITIVAALALAACGDNNKANNGKQDGGTVPMDAPAAGPDASCFQLDGGTGSASNYEIINACTNAQKVYVNPTLPLLVDGGLPALP